MPSSDSSKTSLDTSSKAFSRFRNIVAERDFYPFLKAFIGAAVCINVAIASIVPSPLLKPREYWLIGWADYLTLASTNRPITFESAGNSELVRCDLSFLRIGIILAIFHVVGNHPWHYLFTCSYVLHFVLARVDSF